jgi:chemotaxis protein methyltransferase CheR
MTLPLSAFNWICAVVRDHTGIALDDDKSYLVESRLLPVARAHGCPDVASLIERLRSEISEPILADVLEAMGTKETSWLRDGEPFRVLTDNVLPELMASRQQTRSITVWSAACAWGQEPYSVAMMLDRVLTPQSWNFRIVASDISEAALTRAATGTYHQPEINRGLPAPLLVQHFERAGANWQISEAMRTHVSFVRNNLVLDPPPLIRADIVLMRNVLIYFDLPTRRLVLEKVRQVLAPDGLLLLGAAETTLGVSTDWIRTMHGRTTVNRNGQKGLAVPQATQPALPDALPNALTDTGQR